MKRISTFLLLFLASMTIANSVLAQQNVVLRLNHLFNNAPLVYGNECTEWQGLKIVPSRVDYYLHGIEIVHDGDQVTALEDSFHILVHGNQSDYSLGDHNITNLEGIRFSLGVHPDYNHLDPSQYPTGHPLANQSPDMHWGWTAGYKFLVQDGMIDSDGDSTANFTYELHAVGDFYVRHVDLLAEGTMEGNDLVVNVNVHCERWTNKVELQNVGVFHGSGGQMDRIIDNTLYKNVFTTAVDSGSGPTSLVVDPVEYPALAWVNYSQPYAPSISYRFNTNGEQVQLLLADLSGKVLDSKVHLATAGKYNLPADLPTGIYIANFYQGKEIVISRKVSILR